MSVFRQLLIANAMKRTPIPQDVDGYILDYIEGTGTQWIDTGISPTNTTGTEVDFEYIKNPTTVFCGTHKSSVGRYYLPYRGDGDMVQFGWKEIRNSEIVGNINERVKSSLNLFNNRKAIYNDEIISTLDNNTGNDNTNMYIFRNTYVNAPVQKAKLYSAMTTEESSVQQHLLPFEKQDGTICMWDKETNTYKTNSGTGDFIGGERIGYVENGVAYNMDGSLMFYDIPYTEVEYLNFSGAQYINTGRAPCDNSKVIMKYIQGEHVGNCAPFGSRVKYCDQMFGHVYSAQQNEFLLQFSNGSLNVTTDRPLAGEEVNMEFCRYGVKINGVIRVEKYKSTLPLESTVPVYLGAYNQNGVATWQYTGKFLDFKWYENDSLVQDLRPVVLTQDVQAKSDIKGSTDGVVGEYGMWDMVNNCFFGNQGSGEFTGGEEV